MPDLTRTLNLTDLIAVICQLRTEQYEYERHLALLTFGLWVIEPNDINAQVELASIQFHWKANTRPLHQTLNSIRAANPETLTNVA